jgi:uncharacterized protein YgiM (DUF1202 family)
VYVLSKFHVTCNNQERTPIKKVEVTNTDAKKFTVADMLTIGKQYDVINETEEYYQIIDNSGLVVYVLSKFHVTCNNHP